MPQTANEFTTISLPVGSPTQIGASTFIKQVEEQEKLGSSPPRNPKGEIEYIQKRWAIGDEDLDLFRDAAFWKAYKAAQDYKKMKRYTLEEFAKKIGL